MAATPTWLRFVHHRHPLFHHVLLLNLLCSSVLRFHCTNHDKRHTLWGDDEGWLAVSGKSDKVAPVALSSAWRGGRRGGA